MQLRISEAATGTGQAVSALEELNLNARELNNATGDQQFLAIADALQEVNNQGDRLRLTEDVLGRSGTALVNTLRLGSAEILKQSEFIRANNLELSRVDLAGVEAANDSWSRFTTVIDSVTQRLTADLSPAAAQLFDEFGEIVLSANQLFRAAGGFGQLSAGIRQAALQANAFSAGLSNVAQSNVRNQQILRAQERFRLSGDESSLSTMNTQ